MIRTFLSTLLKIPESELHKDHKELVAFLRLDPPGMVEKLYKSVSKQVIEAYVVDVLEPLEATRKAKSIFGRKIDTDKMKIDEILKELVPKLAVAESTMRLKDVKLVFSKLFRIEDPEDIPDMHPDLAPFVGSNAATAGIMLYENFSAAQVNRFYRELFSDRDEVKLNQVEPAEGGESSSSYQATVRQRHESKEGHDAYKTRKPGTDSLRLDVLGFG